MASCSEPVASVGTWATAIAAERTDAATRTIHRPVMSLFRIFPCHFVDGILLLPSCRTAVLTFPIPRCDERHPLLYLQDLFSKLKLDKSVADLGDRDFLFRQNQRFTVRQKVHFFDLIVHHNRFALCLLSAIL